jgi:hypothetical protein
MIVGDIVRLGASVVGAVGENVVGISVDLISDVGVTELGMSAEEDAIVGLIVDPGPIEEDVGGNWVEGGFRDGLMEERVGA